MSTDNTPEKATSTLTEFIPDITEYYDEVVTTCLMAPQGDPTDPDVMWGIPAIHWGFSGIGKSERHEELAKALNLPFSELVPGQHLPDDFAGLRVLDGKGEFVWHTTLPIEEVLDAPEGLVFIDEATGALPAVQGACLRFLRKRKFGGRKLSPGVRFSLAANPADYAAGGYELEPPTANSFAHFWLSVNTEKYIDYKLNRSLREKRDLTHLKEKLISRWALELARTRGQVVGFLRSNPENLHSQPPAGNPRAGYCWPSPRTWDYAEWLLTTARCIFDGSDRGLAVEQLVVEGCVGMGAATEFHTWLRDANLPSPEVVIVKGWDPDPNRLDIVYAVLQAITQYVLEMPSKDPAKAQERIDAAAGVWRQLKRLSDHSLVDLVLAPARQLTKAKLGLKDSSILEAAAAPVLLALKKSDMIKYIPDELRL